jgi:hypothetical protein
VIHTVSVHFPDVRDVKALRAAARRVGKSPSAFARDALIAEIARQQEKCPTCGAKHEEDTAA